MRVLDSLAGGVPVWLLVLVTVPLPVRLGVDVWLPVSLLLRLGVKLDDGVALDVGELV